MPLNKMLISLASLVKGSLVAEQGKTTRLCSLAELPPGGVDSIEHGGPMVTHLVFSSVIDLYNLCFDPSMQFLYSDQAESELMVYLEGYGYLLVMIPNNPVLDILGSCGEDL